MNKEQKEQLAKRIKRAELIEAACRKLCEDKGIEADRLICPMMPAYLNHPLPTFYVPNPQYTHPAWWMFKDIVEQAILILEAKNA